MNVIVTGANGFIGNSVCTYLCEIGENVLGIVRDDFNASFDTLVTNLDDINETQKLIDDYDTDLIIHCAGAADVGKSFENPILDYQSNLFLVYKLMMAVKEAKRSNIRVIYLSSAAVYGNPLILPISESSALNPLSPYALHKEMAEEIMKYYFYKENVDIKILRIFSAYGPGLKKQLFWDMYNKYKRTSSISMYGTGMESRDYIYIDDLVSAIWTIAKNAPSTELIYNVANGKETTIKEAALMFAQSIGIPTDLVHFSGEEMIGAPKNWKADIEKLSKLGYHPTVSLQEGLNKYIEWIGNNKL